MATPGRIERKFAELRARGAAGLIPFVVAGDPDVATTAALLREMAAREADLIELGVPFSDPMADGPANQRALSRGLKSGCSLASILDLVKEFRADSQIPIVLFGYYNPFLHYGIDRLCRDAAASGVDGLLVVDLPPEENAELAAAARKAGIDLIYLLAPTTPLERSRKLARAARGFLYYVSVTGVTGTRAQVAADAKERVNQLHEITDLPVGVGFGIADPGQAAEVASFADGVVVGSAISLLIERHLGQPDLVAKVGEFIGQLKTGIETARRPPQDAAGA